MSVDLHLGSLLRVPDGTVEPILGFDLIRDVIVTKSGHWPVEDVIPATPPASNDRAAVERWLDGPVAEVVPPATGQEREDMRTVRCADGFEGCTCKQCYRVYHPGIWHHFRDNEACTCGADCCAD